MGTPLYDDEQVKEEILPKTEPKEDSVKPIESLPEDNLD